MLDCQTPKGQIYIKSENFVADKIEELSEGKAKLIKFKELTSSADRFAVSTISNKKIALIEIKSRNLTKEKLEKDYNSEYIISADKINRCLKISVENKIPFFIFVNLMQDEYILRMKIANAQGEIVIPHRIANKTTQATCNGGSKVDSLYHFKTIPPCAYFINKS